MPSSALIVDDDGQYRDIMCRLLSHAGVLVIPVTDGEDALRVLEQTSVDAIVTDLEMPRMDGRKLCAAIRRHPTLHATPILLVSSAEVTPEERTAIGADAFVKKPFTGTGLADAFTALLGERHRGGRIDKPAIRTLTSE